MQLSKEEGIVLFFDEFRSGELCGLGAEATTGYFIIILVEGSCHVAWRCPDICLLLEFGVCHRQ